MNGEGNSRVGVIGIIPAPIAGMRRNSAAEKPTNAARPLTMSASQPRPASTAVCSHDVALALAMCASARVVRVTPDASFNTPEIACSGASVPRMSPASATAGTSSAFAVPSVEASASCIASWPASINARARNASGRVSPSVP
ncbi:MAG: hypothetical protein ACREPV_04800 [Lysobacter sp.]